MIENLLKMKYTKTYLEYKTIHAQMFSPNYEGYIGDVGIDPDWIDSFEGFARFLTDIGECKNNEELVRIDLTIGFYKDNVKWQTIQE